MVWLTALPLLILGIVLWISVSHLIVQAQVASWLEERSIEVRAKYQVAGNAPMSVLELEPTAVWLLGTGPVNQKILIGPKIVDYALPDHLTIRTRLVLRALALLLFFVVFGTLAGLWFGVRRSVVRPVEQLSQRVRSMASAQDENLLSLHVERQRPDEIGALADTFAEVFASLRTHEIELAGTVVRLGNALDDVETTRSRLIQSEQFAAIGEFTSGLAHELGSPLAAAMQQLFLVRPLLKEQDDSEITEPFAYIEEALVRMDGILKALQGVYSKGQVAMTELSLIEFVAKACGRMALASGALVLDLPDDRSGYCVLANRYLLEQSLFNLVRNACESSSGNAPVEVSVGLRGNHAFCRICDHGEGVRLDEDGLPLYNPGKGGMGVGVRIVARAASLMGGSLRYLSSKIGTIVEFELPILVATQHTDEIGQKEEKKHETS